MTQPQSACGACTSPSIAWRPVEGAKEIAEETWTPGTAHTQHCLDVVVQGHAMLFTHLAYADVLEDRI